MSEMTKFLKKGVIYSSCKDGSPLCRILGNAHNNSKNEERTIKNKKVALSAKVKKETSSSL